MSRKESVLCVLRVSASARTERRPAWYSAEHCVENLRARVVEGGGRLQIIADGDVSEGLCAGSEGVLAVGAPGGNSKSFLIALDWVIEHSNPSTLVYMVEQDYLHWHDALTVLTEAFELTDADYATLYDDPLRYWGATDVEPDQPPPGSVLVAGRLAHWAGIESTTMTFAARAASLIRDRAIFESACSGSKPADRRLWRELTLSQGRSLRCSIPAWSTHVESSALAPVRNWRELAGAPLPRQGSRPVHKLAVTRLAAGAALEALFRVVFATESYTVHDVEEIAEAVGLGATHLVLLDREKDECDRMLTSATSVRAVFVEWSVPRASVRWLGGRDWAITEVLSDGGALYHRVSGIPDELD